MKERILKQRWYEVQVTLSGGSSFDEIRDLINDGYSRLHKPYTIRKILDGTVVAQPRNPLHIIWSRNGRRARPYRPFVPKNLRRI